MTKLTAAQTTAILLIAEGKLQYVRTFGASPGYLYAIVKGEDGLGHHVNVRLSTFDALYRAGLVTRLPPKYGGASVDRQIDLKPAGREWVQAHREVATTAAVMKEVTPPAHRSIEASARAVGISGDEVMVLAAGLHFSAESWAKIKATSAACWRAPMERLIARGLMRWTEDSGERLSLTGAGYRALQAYRAEVNK
ncbi:hypothetical protein [Stenotrophomonas phage BUCT603B1]|nr:hypothetical protein [Stenotrophomonas phage BUCT603B1]HDS1003805.1 hypothetical protein [Stenotrophomonas maltophilia]